MLRPARRRIGTAAAAALAALPLAAFTVRTLPQAERLSRGDTNVRVLHPADEAAWIWMPGHDVWGVAADADAWSDRLRFPAGDFFRFRREFTADASPLRLHVSSDERFVLLLDGREIGRGPLRGMVEHWYFQSYEISGLPPGPHALEAVCWQLGASAPIAQLSYRGGFVLRAEGSYDRQLTTGRAAWRVARLDGTKMTDRGTSRTFGAGTQCRVVGTGLTDEQPPEPAWTNAAVVRGAVTANAYGGRTKGWMLFPADRPEPMRVRRTPGRVVNAAADLSRPFTVPASTTLDLWWDLDDYCCAYPELQLSGGAGATVTWGWTESLLGADGKKGNRDEWRGKDFAQTLTDTFVADGRRTAVFTTPWWRCGRWCRLTFATGDAPLDVRSVALVETRYPLRDDSRFECDDQSLGGVLAISRRALENCLHDMVFDCPYYEQQMYPGDTRLQLKFLSALSADDRLRRFALSVFDWDRRSDGMVAMNFPTRGTQESATYTMCWIMMMRDCLMESGDLALLRERMPGVRAALMGLGRYAGADGLLRELPGWSFVDWVWGERGFECGVPPDALPGSGSVSSIVNLQYLLALESAAATEAALGEADFAAVARKRADRVRESLRRTFWDAERGLIADDPGHRRFSEHGQCLAIVADLLDDAQRRRALAALEKAEGLAPVSSYFAFYLFEALAKGGRPDLVLRRLEVWRQFLKVGARTAFESQETEFRSDCHGWSAAPVYFAHRMLAGVTPLAPGFARVRVAPQPGGLRRIRSATPTPHGSVQTDFSFKDNLANGTVTLPPGVDGEFVWRGKTVPLVSGGNRIKGE